MQSVEIGRAAASARSLPMNSMWRTIRSYVLWQHERGTLHYDIMVTLILLFVFISPRVINFNDKPTASIPHPAGIIVTSDETGGLVYQVPASMVLAGDDSAVRRSLLHAIQPISGDVSITKYESVADRTGRLQEYRVWVKR